MTRLNTLPHNNRALQIFRIIREHAILDWASVVDFGCGYGDMSVYAALFGASRVMAVDNDPTCIEITAAKAESMGLSGSIVLHKADIRNLANETLGHHEYGFCLSVLPYLPDEDRIPFLKGIVGQIDVLFLEVQYAGDGPGLEFIHDDDEMFEWLKENGITAYNIGQTLVKEGRYRRTIWKCHAEHKKNNGSGLPEVGQHMVNEIVGERTKLTDSWAG